MSLASSVPSIVLALPLSRFSSKYPTRANVLHAIGRRRSRAFTLRFQNCAAALLSTLPRSFARTIG